MSIPTSNDQVNQELQKFFLLSYQQPAVCFDLIYPYTYLFITDVVLSMSNKNGRQKATMLLDYFLRITLKKTNGERQSFSVNFIKYIETMRVLDQLGNMAFTLNLAIAGENIQTKAINSQDPYFHYVEIALERTITNNTNKPIELKIYYRNCDGLELNKI